MPPLQRAPRQLSVSTALGRQHRDVLHRELLRRVEAEQALAGPADGVYEYKAVCSSGHIAGRGVRLILK